MEPQTIKPQRYNNLDGLRTLASIGVICMHVRANIGFEISGADCPKTQISLFESTTCCAMEEAESLHVVPQETEIRVFGQLGGGILDYLINTLIAQMGGFVQLFYILSGFSMCCGYYEKIKNNQISLNKFYSRRYEKILPFFTLLVLIDLAVGLLLDGGISLGSLAEAFADLTLMFGFYTTSGMSVIGVGWTLGIIFGFYILFPFFVYLIWDKKRAWFSLLLTNVIYLLCVEYFQSGSSLTFRWMCYFVLGGLIYLYKDSIGRFFANKTWLGLVFIIAGFGIVYMIPFSGTGALETVIRL
ncbi:MAG: acyltransferase family protein [Bacteroides sp.]|nr:acyltransferase family protein [Bacteroides sp.]